VSVTEDSITIAWNKSTDNSGRIHAYIAGGLYHSGTSTTKTFTSLVPNWTVTYRVQAMDPSGNVSGLSAPLTVTTLPDLTAPTTPGNLRVTGTGISTVSLGWDRSSDRWSFGYEVLMDGAVLTSAGHPFTGTPSTTLRTVPPGTHTFQVRARDWAGNLSGLSNAVTVTLEGNGDTTPPTAPSNLTVEDLNDNCGSQILRWTGSTDDSGRVEYEIYRNGHFWFLTGATELFTYTQPGTNTWTVVAVDEAGNRSAPSDAVTLTIVARREPLLELVRKIRQELGAVLAHEHEVLEPHASELLAVAARLQRDDVTRQQRVGRAAEVRALVDFEADAVA
jgi:chitodextrinase